MVVVDSSIWIDYLAGQQTQAAAALQRLVDERQAAYTGVVLAELMRGMRNDEERAELELELSGCRYIETGISAWRRAGAIAQELDMRGERIAMTDVFVAAAALEGDHELFTRDEHFERIPGLRLYKEAADG